MHDPSNSPFQLFYFGHLGRVAISEADRPILRQTFDTLVKYIGAAQWLGLLALDDLLESEPDPLVRNTLQMVTDGCDPELVAEVLHLGIVVDHATCLDLAQRLMVWRTAIGLLQGDSPWVIQNLLRTWVGDEVDWHKFPEMEEPPFIENPETSLEFLISLDETSCRAVLRELDEQELLHVILLGSQQVRSVILVSLGAYRRFRAFEQAKTTSLRLERRDIPKTLEHISFLQALLDRRGLS